MNLLYLHGLNSKLHDDRREVLELYPFNIYAPNIDYPNHPNLLNDLLSEYKDVDLVIGSSAGGLAGYYFSGLIEKPALLFNPALPFRKLIPKLPILPIRQTLLQVVLGAQDQEVDPFESFKIISKENPENCPIKIHWNHKMGHSLPIGVFKEEVKFFCDNIL